MTPTAPRALASICAGLLALGSALAQTSTNDNFTNRTALAGAVPISVSGDNTGTTLENGEVSLNGSGSVWWGWTPAVDGTYIIDTFGSLFDTARDRDGDRGHAHDGDGATRR